MSSILYTLPFLACPIGMGLMMWLMMRGKRADAPGTPTSTPVPGEVGSPVSVELLREEHRRLDEQLESLEGAERTGAGT